MLLFHIILYYIISGNWLTLYYIINWCIIHTEPYIYARVRWIYFRLGRFSQSLLNIFYINGTNFCCWGLILVGSTYLHYITITVLSIFVRMFLLIIHDWMANIQICMQIKIFPMTIYQITFHHIRLQSPMIVSMGPWSDMSHYCRIASDRGSLAVLPYRNRLVLLFSLVWWVYSVVWHLDGWY